MYEDKNIIEIDKPCISEQELENKGYTCERNES